MLFTLASPVIPFYVTSCKSFNLTKAVMFLLLSPLLPPYTNQAILPCHDIPLILTRGQQTMVCESFPSTAKFYICRMIVFCLNLVMSVNWYIGLSCLNLMAEKVGNCDRVFLAYKVPNICYLAFYQILFQVLIHIVGYLMFH